VRRRRYVRQRAIRRQRAPAEIDQQHAAFVTAERAIDLYAGTAVPGLVVQQHHAGQEATVIGHTVQRTRGC